jgi:glycosyltransferase involved in cell wall biosynthesis
MNTPKRILIFSLDYLPGDISGAESAIQDITDRIPPEDIEFHMVTLYYNSRVPRVQKIGNVTIHYVGIWGRPDPTIAQRGMSPLHYNKYFFQIAAGMYGWYLHMKHRYDGAWAMMAHGTGVPVSIFNIMTGVPYALSLQEGDPPEYIERTMRPLWWLFRRAFTHAAIVQPISSFLAEWARRMGYAGDIELIPDGANPGSIHPAFDPADVEAIKERYGKKEGDIWLINTARLVQQKGWDTVIEALAMLPSHIKLMIVGSGPEEERLRELVSRRRLLDRVFFTGQVDRSEVSKYRFAADIFVGPSRSEGLGHAFLSAMACKLPVITTQVGGIADFLFDARRDPDRPTTGWAVDPEQPGQIAAAVEEILENREKTATVVATAREMVLREYDWDLIARKMEERVFNRLWN